MASGIAHLASDQRLLAMASWVARLASDEGLLAAASDEQTTTGSSKFLQKVTNISMLNLKTIRIINPIVILGSARKFLHQFYNFTSSDQ